MFVNFITFDTVFVNLIAFDTVFVNDLISFDTVFDDLITVDTVLDNCSRRLLCGTARLSTADRRKSLQEKQTGQLW